MGLDNVCPALSWVYEGGRFPPSLDIRKMNVSAKVHTPGEDDVAFLS